MIRQVRGRPCLAADTIRETETQGEVKVQLWENAGEIRRPPSKQTETKIQFPQKKGFVTHFNYSSTINWIVVAVCCRHRRL